MLTNELGLHDVSILFPLPAKGELGSWLGADSTGRHGVLLPEWLASELPVGEARADLRVVAMRIDPCFPSLVGAPKASCRFQLRLTLQPLTETNGEVAAGELALHLFYDLPVSDFIALTGELGTARPEAIAGPLDVHPTLAAEGLAGSYAASVRAALLDAAGESRLRRVTFSTAGASGHSMSFGGVDLVSGKAAPIAIAGTGVSEQSFVVEPSSDPDRLSAQVVPKLSGALDDMGPLYDRGAASKLDEAALWSLYETTLRVENPSLRSSANVDCVSCHTAGSARLWLEQGHAFASRPSGLRFASQFDLALTHPPEDALSLRAFGYSGKLPVISARTVNESAAVALYLNERLVR